MWRCGGGAVRIPCGCAGSGAGTGSRTPVACVCAIRAHSGARAGAADPADAGRRGCLGHDGCRSRRMGADGPLSGLGAAWYRSLKSASRAGISVQPAVSDPVVAVRAALGVAIALFGALILVGRVHAVLPALGAELTGMATLQPGFRR